jgi:hypothetical protein
MNQNIAKFCNCTKKDECPSPGAGFECCSETVPNGSPSRFGLWMKQSTCDPSKGLPKDAHLMEKFKYIPNVKMTGTVEGYNDMYPYPSQKSACKTCGKAYPPQQLQSQQNYPTRYSGQPVYAPTRSRSHPKYMEEQEYEDEDEEEEEEDPCADLRNSFNILVIIMLLAIIGGAVYYLKYKDSYDK